MWKSACSAATFAALIAMPVPAQEQIELDPRGAVLCSYAIVTSLSRYAETCDQGGPEVRRELDQLLDLHRDFVMRNGPASSSELSEFEAKHSSMGRQLCGNEDLAAMLTHIEQSLAAFGKDLRDSLSVDRKPVWNPCL